MKSVLILFHRTNLNPRMELFAETLRDHQYNFKALCWDRGGTSNHGNDSIETERIGDFGRSESLLNILYLPIIYVLFTKLMLRKSPDIILCGHISLLPLAVLFGKARDTPVVYDVVEFYVEGYSNRSSVVALVVAKPVLVLERLVLPWVSGITVIDSANDIIRKRYDNYTDNIQTICNVPRLKPVSETNRQNSKKRIVYAGLINERKGVINLVNSFTILSKDINHVELVLVGGGSTETIERIENMSIENGIENLVILTGQVEYDRVHEILTSADIGVAPYQPNPMFEKSRWNARKIPDYMNAQLPVLVPNFQGFSEMLDEADFGLQVDTKDANSIADALKYLLDNPQVARQKGENGRSLIERKYNWEKESKKVISVIEQSFEE